jgi:hypothetical protein
VLALLSALGDALDAEGFPVDPGAAIAAAENVYRESMSVSR